ncbi:MAG: electron transfer flavoprotein subunit alpha/FixB family protein [Bryobacteraceae bacterium]|jgi:electron transfer flavoprotein alpha subunit
MSGVLVICEQTAGVWNRMSFETLAAAQQLARAQGRPVAAVVFGHGTAPLAAELAACALDRVYSLEHERLASYTADGATAALEWLISRARPDVVLLPHTYRVRDFAPRLAARAGRPLISDVTGFRVEQGELILERQLFQGRLNADYSVDDAGPVFASLQAGSFRADAVESGSAPVEVLTPPLDDMSIRQSPEAPFRESARELDLAAAELIVAVGRGIHEEGNIELVQELATALGAELAASRPICDNGWLPMERQVGSSGQTVAPKLYIAVGISGAIQHLVGMKGARTIVAINKDASAPIFESADYGIVGDLFEVVPALTELLRKAQA